ncbi:Autolysin sensor kinase [Polaromonas sp. CG9_12]|nr:Autolysin sensor kinase [Polaromonas sp. CG9_12]
MPENHPGLKNDNPCFLSMTPTTAPQDFDNSTLHGGLAPTDTIAAVSPFAPRAMLFDTCHVGVVLRVVLLVQAVAGVAAMFGTLDPLDWLLRFSLLTGGVLPATLAWLVAVCVFKGRLNRLGVSLQWLAGTVMGAVAGAYGCGLLALMGLLSSPSWWASGASGVLLSALVLAGLIWRAKARMPAATTARLAELQSRIRPHFLFNTLNSAIALVRAEPAKAEAVLEDLSELFRSALADPAESVTLAQEIFLAQRYLDIEQVRFGDRLRVQWSLDPGADAARLPPLLLQPLVENAVLHGVEPSASGARILISTTRRGGTVVIKVTNSAPAGSGRPGHGLALTNVRERLFLLHDVQAQFRTTCKDGLFQVRLEVPL